MIKFLKLIILASLSSYLMFAANRVSILGLRAQLDQLKILLYQRLSEWPLSNYYLKKENELGESPVQIRDMCGTQYQ